MAIVNPASLLAGMDRRVAQELADHVGGILRCSTCRRSEVIDGQNVARYLQDGWPKCCGQTMLWMTRRQLEETQ